MLRQCVYAIACGKEDINDHDDLRRDIALQTTVGTDRLLASASTLCRLGNRAQRLAALNLNVFAGLIIYYFTNNSTRKIILNF